LFFCILISNTKEAFNYFLKKGKKESKKEKRKEGKEGKKRGGSLGPNAYV
jgi:hypothetical protein